MINTTTARIATIAITIRTSIKENPFDIFFIFYVIIDIISITL